MAGILGEGKYVSFSLEFVQFVNDGNQQNVTHHVQNCTAVSRRLRTALSKDSDKSFSLAAGKEERVLAAGLRLPVVINYVPRDLASHSGTLDLFADDVLQMRVPIISNPPSAVLKIDPDGINFGNIAQNHQTISRTLSLLNVGSAQGVLRLDTSHLPPYITVAPIEGAVEPKEKADITVSVLCRKVCSFREKISISFDNSRREVPIIGNIVSARLELMSPANFSPVGILNLGSMYYGAVIKKKVTLYNNSPSNTSFITLWNTQCRGYEEGVDMSGELSLACTTGGLYQNTWKEQGTAPASYKMLSVSPEEGTMSPYETRLVEVSFSPEFNPSEKGWKNHQGLMSRRDYALFLKFIPVGENTKDGEAELGVSASVLPVNVSSSPAKQLQFGSCTTGLPQCRELTLTNNNSDSLPVNFKIRVLAHYKAEPVKGTVEAGGSRTIIVVFHPKQFGRLNGLLHVDVFGEGRESPVHTHTVSLLGTGAVEGGGLRKRGERKKRLATLDDLSCSIRPHDKRVEVTTPFTKVKRHTYTDPDYALTEEETGNKVNHQNYYQQYLREQQRKRQKKNTDRRMGNTAYSNETDIGMQPAAGINTPSLSLPPESSEHEPHQTDTSTTSDKVWTTKTQTNATGDELTMVYSPLLKPCSVSMAEQCQAVLTPRELSMLEIDTVSLDLGNIVKKIRVVREVKIKNHLSRHLLCRIKVISPSLRILSSEKGDSEWKCVLFPHSCTPISFGFSSNTCGSFHQSIECLINREHTFQIPVSATITHISLTPSPTTVTLAQHPLSTHNTCLEGTVSLHNSHHVPAHFSWDLGNHREYLMMSNPDGSVPPRSSVNCHFQYQEEGQGLQTLSVTLCVEDGESWEIICNLEYGKSDCSFKETVLFFNPASLFLPTCKTITCVNKGLSHTYYKVVGCDPPIQGVEVTPSTGCIPACSKTELSFQLTASELGSFESWFKLKLKEGKTMSLRVTGSIELPRVYIDLDEFKFGSVYCGSSASLPFTVYNKGQAHVHLTFNLTSLPDFKVSLPTNPDPYKGENDMSSYSSPDGLYQIFLPSNSSAQCDLIFSPKDVAAYDFIIPVLINGNDPISPPLSQWPPSHADPQIAIGHPLPTLKDTPKRRVMATTLVAPLEVKNTLVASQSPPITSQHVIQLHNISSEPVTWALGDGAEDSLSTKRIKDGTFKFFMESGASFNPPSTAVSPSLGDTGHLLPNENFTFFAKFSPPHHGQYTASVPLYLNGNSSRPYRHLELAAELSPERILTSPAHIAVHPVPLGVTVEAEFTIILNGFSGTVQLEATLPDHFPDGVQVTVNLPDRFEKPNHQDTSIELSCEILFCSDVPVSITDSIILQERKTGKMKKIPFSVCAENSIFSVYEFISENLNSSQFQRDPAMGIPLLHLPSSRYHASSSRTSSAHNTLSSTTTLRAGSSLPHTLSSCSTSYGTLFLTDCKSYMCRYLSLFGWPEGLRNIRHPTDLVQCVGKEFSDAKNQYSRALGTSRGPLLDLVRHLCGRLPPGVPLTPIPCKTRADRVNRHYQELTITLAFLRSQGALLWVVVPEGLMDWRDFCYWRETNPASTSFLINATVQEFHDAAEQTWSHLLGQILKVLVLPRLLSTVPSNLKGELKVKKNHISNVYSKHELLLLTWMNRLIERGGRLVHSGVERMHHVVTFDLDLMDCTVLASVIAAYAPYMVDRYFSKMYSEPLTPEQVNHNALLLVAACREMNLNYDVQPSDLSAPNPIGLALFAVYLFHSLPGYTPETTITLEGELSTKATQKVKIENPSNRPLVYKTVIMGDGKDCFSVEDSITIPPRSSEYLQITFSVRFLSPCSAVLLLLSRMGIGRPGRTVAFTLKGSSTFVKPAIISSVEACLYEALTIPVSFTNVFGKAGKFLVHLTEGTMLQESPLKKKRAGKIKGVNPSTLISTERLTVRSADSMRLFHSKASSVLLEPQEKETITVGYTPLKIQPRQCCILLSCEMLGDIVVLVNTSVSLPSPARPVTNGLLSSSHINEVTETLHLKAIVGEVIKEEMVIENRNRAFEAAVLELNRWEMEDKEMKRRRDTNSLQYASLQKAMAALELDSSLKTHWDKMTEGSDELHFSVTGDSDFFKLPGKVSIPATRNGKVALPIEFLCDAEGRYSCHIVLRSPHDVRVYCVEVMVMDKGRTAELEIVTPALEPVTQKIPIANPTTIDWPLRADLTGKGFSGPLEFNVKALTTCYYPLTFSPRRECQTEGCLRLMNTNDKTEHCFTLRGIGERPLAQENITIHAKAKTSIGHILHVPNTSDRSTTYRVECDLLDCVSGPSTITVTGGDVADYPIVIDPLVRGTFSGAVVFTAEMRSGFIRPSSPIAEHLWYQLNVTVDPADPLDTLTIKGQALSQSEHTHVVTNPFSDPVTLKVTLDGNGLSGPNELFVKADSRSLYTFSYAPLRVGRDKGAVLFTGREDGEITVEFDLLAEDPKAVDLGTAECELGKSVYGSLTLNNPLDKEVTFYNVTENNHFSVIGLVNGEICVPAKSSSEVAVMFKPTCLGPDHKATLTFTSDEFGHQDFLMEGVGLFPSPLPPTTITSQLQSNSMAIISFTNPLSRQASFTINLKMQHDLFCLFLKQSSDISLQSGVSLDIPIMFAPDSMEMTYAELTVSTNDGAELDVPLLWVYPIHGIPEQLVPLSPKNPGVTVNGRAKERVEMKIEVYLDSVKSEIESNSGGLDDSLEEINPTLREKYFFDLVSTEDGHTNLKEFIGMQLVEEIEGENSEEIKLTFNTVFLPSKPLRCKAELHIQPMGNGLWRFPLLFEASDPLPDDTIVLKARNLTKETKTSFRLTSLTSQETPFTASFTSSISELSVSPSSGTLPPEGTAGALITITYKPRSFSQSSNGILKIETPSAQWSYKVVGEPMSYSSPSKYSMSRVDDRWDGHDLLKAHHSKRNFLRHNIEQSSHLHRVKL